MEHLRGELEAWWNDEVALPVVSLSQASCQCKSLIEEVKLLEMVHCVIVVDVLAKSFVPGKFF